MQKETCDSIQKMPVNYLYYHKIKIIFICDI